MTLRSTLTAMLALAGSIAAAQNGPQPRLPTVPITAGMHVIHAEVAEAAEQQMTGMMFRREMAANDGMLFVNADAGMRCFWMRNTLLPLSIAFIADDGSIVNLADMAPQTEDSHCSDKPVRYALEMRQGWFAQHGIKPGFRLKGKPFGGG